MKERKFRKKTSTLSFQTEEDEGGIDARTEPGTIAAQSATAQEKKEKKKKEKKKDSKASLLSFEEDDLAVKEEKRKNVKPNRQVMLPGFRTDDDGQPKPQSTQMSMPGEYSREKLLELQKNTVRLPASKTPATSAAAAPFKVSGSFKLTGSFKAAAKDDRFHTTTAALLREPDHPAENPLPPPPPRPPRTSVPPPAPPAAPPTAAAEHPAEHEDEEEHDFKVPDADTIRRAKEKRERLRSAHLAPDYIPMGGATALTSKRGAEPVVGVDDGSDDEAEDHMRIAFFGSKHEQKGRAGGVLAAVDTQDGVDGVEDEEDSWAQEQLRKAMGARGAEALPPATTGAASPLPDDIRVGPAASHPLLPLQRQSDAIFSAGEDVIKALLESVQRMKANQVSSERQSSRIAGELETRMRNVELLEGQLSKAADKYAFVQQLKSYIADLCDMLQEKSPYVEVLEEDMKEVAVGRAEAYLNRCRADDRDELLPAEAAVHAATSLVTRGGQAESAAAAAESAYAAAEEKLLGLHLPVDLDEFGRDKNVMKRHEMQQRAQRRHAALDLILSVNRGSGRADWLAGEETTDESDSEVSHYNSKRAELVETASKIFSDAADEFGSLGMVKARLEGCKVSHPGAYRDAYLSDSAPALLAPFVRLQLLDYDPVYKLNQGFDRLPWYQQLFDFGLTAESNGMAVEDDADSNLLPSLVMKLVVPLLHHRVRHCWQPCSVRQSSSVAAAVEEVLLFHMHADNTMQALLRSVEDRLRSAVDDVVVPVWPPTATNVVSRSRAILGRRFGKALRLVRSCAQLDRVVDRSVLVKLVLGKLIQGKLLGHLRSAMGQLPVAVDRICRLTNALPDTWLEAGLPKEGAELLELCRVLARSLESQRTEQGDNQAAAVKLVGVLRKLQETERADRLSKAYKLDRG